MTTTSPTSIIAPPTAEPAITSEIGKRVRFYCVHSNKIFYNKTVQLHNYISSLDHLVSNPPTENQTCITRFENLVASVFLLLTATDVDGFIGDVIMVFDDTIVVTVVSDGDPQMTLTFPSIPPLKPVT